jgi:hypothetical protein
MEEVCEGRKWLAGWGMNGEAAGEFGPAVKCGRPTFASSLAMEPGGLIPICIGPPWG